ncbi:MAG: response regulator [Elusimicrobia bacterium]|nr:response regulator [Elusimicrobiota bacterium]
MDKNEENTILVVDDEKNIRKSIKRILQKYEVKAASSAEEGLKLLQEENFKVILLDIDLPGMNGIEMLNKINEKFSDKEVIMVTGMGTIEDAVSAMKLGAYDFITKPFEIKELRKLVEKAVEKANLVKELDIMNAVCKIVKDVGGIKPIDEMLDEILDISIKSTNAEGGSIGIFNEKEKKLVIKVSRGPDAEKSLGNEIKSGEKVSGWVIESKKPVLINGSLEKDKRFKNINSRGEITSGICVPMIMRDKVLGTLNLKKIKEGNRFSKTDLQIISIFAQQAAFSVQNAYDYSNLLNLDKLKDEFLANVSHELRTPLQSITNACEILEKKHGTGRLTELLKRNSKRMNKLIIELLDISKIENGSLDISFKSFSVRDIVREVSEDVSPAAKEKDIVINHKISPEVKDIKADKDMIKRVLINLLGNSIKYCPEKSKVNIIAKKTKEGVEFSVSDNGPGIPAEEQKRIFEKFYQQKPGQSLTEKHTGIGLGLAMVKSIVNQHGGKVSIDSTQGRGAVFKFTLPQNPSGKKGGIK